MRTAMVEMDLTNAWETWLIEITDPNAPDEITKEWLEDNPNGWQSLSLGASGHDNATITKVEDQ